MMFQQSALSSGEFYQLMLQSIVPRPIAWVLSENADGTFNVAPFSFFNGVCAEPPLLMIAVGRKDDDTPKDTWANIDERSEFVVHIPPSEQTDAMVATSKPLPAGVSEIPHAGLSTMAVEGQRLPRLIGPKIALFCRKYSITEVGTERSSLILGEIVSIWADDEIVRQENGRTLLDPKKIDPVTRLGGLSYGLLGAVKDVRRPK